MYEQCLNKVEIRGTIGSVREDASYYQIGICTNYAYGSDNDNCKIIETTWHDCIIKKKDMTGVPKKGVVCHIVGRLKQRDFVTPDGRDVRTYQIVGTRGSSDFIEK